MLQFYLLSVVSTIVAGLALSGDYLGKNSAFFSGFGRLRENRSLQITTGLITAVVGVLKLILRSPGDRVPVVGDFLPAVFGIGLGVILIAEVFRQEPEGDAEAGPGQKSVEKVSRTLLTYRVPVGIAGVVIGLLHFLFPRVIFL